MKYLKFTYSIHSKRHSSRGPQLLHDETGLHDQRELGVLVLVLCSSVTIV